MFCVIVGQIFTSNKDRDNQSDKKNRDIPTDGAHQRVSYHGDEIIIEWEIIDIEYWITEREWIEWKDTHEWFRHADWIKDKIDENVF